MAKDSKRLMMVEILDTLDDMQLSFRCISERLSNMETRLANIDKRHESIEQKITNIEHAQQLEKNTIEVDLHQYMFNNIYAKFPGYTAEEYSKHLVTLRHHTTGKLLNDYENLFLLSSQDDKSKVFVFVYF